MRNSASIRPAAFPPPNRPASAPPQELHDSAVALYFREAHLVKVYSSVSASSPRSILFLIRSLQEGGAERQLSLLASALAKRGIDTHVAVFYGGGAFEGALASSGVRIHDLGKRSRWDSLSFMLRLRRLVREIQPEVVHSYGVVPNILLGILKPLLGDTRLVWGVRAAAMEWSQFDWLVRSSFQFSRVIARAADSIIVNSHAGAAFHISKGYDGSRVSVIPNGVDASHFVPPALEERRELRSQHGFAPGDVVVGMVGRLDPMKDHGTFLRAAAAFSRHYTAARFVIVGRGEPKITAEITALASSLGIAGRTTWVSGCSDPRDWYKMFDLSVSSSIGEGTSNTILEAMSSGVRCVVTDVGDSALLVHGIGIVVRPRDSAALCEGMCRAMELDPDRFRESARRRVLDVYSPWALATATLEVLGRLRSDSHRR